jgi:hypothetical protein
MGRQQHFVAAALASRFPGHFCGFADPSLNRLIRRKYLVAGGVKREIQRPMQCLHRRRCRRQFLHFFHQGGNPIGAIYLFRTWRGLLNSGWILLDLVMSKKNAADIRIDHIHSRAICDEIGERLRETLRREALELPPHLQLLVDRLAELDGGSAPSIVPSFEDMLPRRELHSSSV